MPFQNFDSLRYFMRDWSYKKHEITSLNLDSEIKRIEFPDGSIYEGTYNLQYCLDGRGIIYLPNGDQFKGIIKKNVIIEG